MNEECFEIIPELASRITTVRPVKVACTNPIDASFVSNALFILMDDEQGPRDQPQRLVSVASPPGAGLAVLVWEQCDDGVYRVRADLNITRDLKYIIDQRMPDGAYRRSAMQIVF